MLRTGEQKGLSTPNRAEASLWVVEAPCTAQVSRWHLCWVSNRAHLGLVLWWVAQRKSRTGQWTARKCKGGSRSSDGTKDELQGTLTPSLLQFLTNGCQIAANKCASMKNDNLQKCSFQREVPHSTPSGTRWPP